MTEPRWQANIRIPPPWWEAWGRVCARLGTDRTARITGLLLADIEAHGDEADLADLERGRAEHERRRARNRIGRRPAPARPPAAADDGTYMEILERAMDHARHRHPEASPQKRAAFANSVAYAVTGWSGGYGGPSVREYAAGAVLRPVMPLSFEEAAALLDNPDGVIFGPLTASHRQAWADLPCHGDDPDDIAALGGD